MSILKEYLPNPSEPQLGTWREAGIVPTDAQLGDPTCFTAGDSLPLAPKDKVKNKEQLEEAARAAWSLATSDPLPPEGYYSEAQWSRILGKPRTTVQAALVKLVREGAAEVTELRYKGKMSKFYKIRLGPSVNVPCGTT